MENNALIGYTGFVGGTLLKGREFKGLFNSKNVEELAGRSFDTIYCAGAPAAKWIANKEPENDRATIDRIIKAVRSATARSVVLLSTVDVYRSAVDVDETSDTPLEDLQPYGLNRLRLEKELSKSFETTILRLPGLFGDGLKKNAIYDLLNNNNVEKIDSRSTFQFYDMQNLWNDIQKTRDAGIKLLNVTSPPLSIREIAKECFEREFKNEFTQPAPFYDFKSIHAERWGGHDGYLYSRESIITALRRFVNSYTGERAA